MKGMSLTLRHLLKSVKNRRHHDIRKDNYFDEKEGIATLRYPYEAAPAPDHGRYQLYNEIEDCIVCDKCAKICPVDCIDIEPIKSTGEFGKTSDGSPKRLYAARFDIDMGKCCYCGLCTTVCPTECLTMTDEYDFSVFELGKLNFGFGNLTDEEAAQKRKEWEEHQEKKKNSSASGDQEKEARPAMPRPAFRPGKPVGEGAPPTEEPEKSPDLPQTEAPKPVFRPGMRPVKKTKPPEENV